MRKIPAAGGTLIQECVQHDRFATAKPHWSKGFSRGSGNERGLLELLLRRVSNWGHYLDEYRTFCDSPPAEIALESLLLIPCN
jgi:hypothetical protein